MQFEARQVDEFAAVAPRHVLRTLEVSDGIAGRADGPAVSPAYEQRFFVGCCHLFIL
jgi:hypothetical protein